MTTENVREAQDELDRAQNAPGAPLSFGSAGDYYGSIAIYYMDSTSWGHLLDDLHLDKAAFTDPGHPRALGLNTFQTVLPDGGYVSSESFAAPGTIELYSFPEKREGWFYRGLQEGEADEPILGFVSKGDTKEDVLTLPASEGATMTMLEVSALVVDEPDTLNVVGASRKFPSIILPENVVKDTSGSDESSNNPFTYSSATFSFMAQNHAQVAEQLEVLTAKYPDMRVSVVDIAESARQARLISQTIQLFIVCFSVITILIAVANVFNTLANSILLRTREFSVLKSIGMGNRTFAHMLAYECASYAVRGLAIGLLVSLATTYALYQATSITFVGLPFVLPWAHIAFAVGIVLGILVLSVFYALHRSHASSIVEALRADVM